MQKPLNVKIDEAIYDNFYSACKVRGSNMTTQITNYMRQYAATVRKDDPEVFDRRKQKDAERKTKKK